MILYPAMIDSIELKTSWLSIANDTAADLAQREASRKHSWSFFNSDLESYEFTFHPLIREGLIGFLMDRLDQKKGRVVLDLMGTGRVLHELPIERGLAVSLGDGRDESEKMIDSAWGIDLLGYDEKHPDINMNLLGKSAWDRISDWLKTPGKPGFDLILSRPAGGLRVFPEKRRLLFCLLNQAWQLLTPDGGVLLTQYPKDLKKDLLPWLTFARGHGISGRAGLDTIGMDRILRLNRSPSNPSHLPLLRAA